MKIVQLVPSLDIGGLERLTLDLALRQKAEGDEALIYCTSHPGTLASVAESAGVCVRAFGKRDGFSIRLLGSLTAALKRDRPDVLHAHNALVLHYAVAAARLARITAVVNTRHGGNMNWDPHCEAIWRRTIPWADSVVFISEGVRDYYLGRDHLPRRDFQVIHNGIDVRKFSSRAARPGRNRPRFAFGCVARLVPAKDHATLIKAFARLAPEMPEAELHILGDGPCRNDLEYQAGALRIGGKVVFHGAAHDVADFLSRLDTFVLASVDEGLPISLMEAMAAGLPVISTSLPGLRELAPEEVVAGYVPPRMPDLLADLMKHTARRRDLGAVGAAAARWAERFDIAGTWRKYRDLFDQILTAKGLRRTGGRTREVT